MKKISYFVVGLLLISSLAAIGQVKGAGDNNQTTINVSFSNLGVKNSDIQPYAELSYDGAGGCYYNAGAPILPSYTKEITFPFGTRITNIDCTTSEIKSTQISKKVIPAPTPVIPDSDNPNDAQYTMDQTIYSSNQLFPDNWFEYYTGAGLDENGQHKTFLVVQITPARYNPVTDTINYVENIQLTVHYADPITNPFPSTTAYQMVIIAPSAFQSSLQKLVTYKNSKGITTVLETTEDIYAHYTGVDKPEQIKYFIKYAIENWNIKYVLLVGGLDSLIYGNPRDTLNYGAKDWYLPVRYTNLRESSSEYDPGMISDLYYADIYNATGGFSSWDSNGDGIFAKWDNHPGKDVIDFYPDVYVGRLPCESKLEVNIMVNKIINYEKGAYGSSWANKMILCGGDSFDDVGTNYNEGEVTSELTLTRYMSEYTPVRMYASYKDSNPDFVPMNTNIEREISKGAGFLFFDGHGNPASWTTHYPRTFNSWIPNGGIGIKGMQNLWNFNKLPICTVEGCHNSQFNVSLLYAMRDKKNAEKSWCYGGLVYECWSWILARKVGGGSVATIGNTGLGYGTVGEHGDLDADGINDPDCFEALGGYFFRMFYKAFDEGYDNLGAAWGMAVKTYLDTFPGMKDQADAKEMEQLILIGDPSLKMGGYPTGNGLRAEIVDAAAGVTGSPSENVVLQAQAYNSQGDVVYNWDFNNDGKYDDAQGEVASWNWASPGVYWVSVKATDGSGKSDTYDTIVSIEIGATTPDKPTKVNNVFTTNVDNQDGYWNHIYYKFSWGDGTETDWSNVPSATHTWSSKGTYEVKAKAMLTHEAAKDGGDFEDAKETDWSDPLTVTKSRDIERPLLTLLHSFFEKYPNAFPILRLLLEQLGL